MPQSMRPDEGAQFTHNRRLLSLIFQGAGTNVFDQIKLLDVEPGFEDPPRLICRPCASVRDVVINNTASRNRGCLICQHWTQGLGPLQRWIGPIN